MINCQFDLSGRDFRGGSRKSARSASNLQKNAAGSQLSVNTKASSTVRTITCDRNDYEEIVCTFFVMFTSNCMVSAA